MGKALLNAQVKAMQRSGCSEVILDETKADSFSSQILDALLESLRPGETLTVVRKNSLCKSGARQAEIIRFLKGAGVNFISLRESINTENPRGMLPISLMGYDNSDGLTLEPKVNGCPAAVTPVTFIKKSDRVISEKINKHRDYMRLLEQKESEWLPFVKILRPYIAWSSVLSILNNDLSKEQKWSMPQLLKAVRAYIADGNLNSIVLDEAWQKRIDRNLLQKISKIKSANYSSSPEEICSELKKTNVYTPAGSREWHPEVIVKLLCIIDSKNR